MPDERANCTTCGHSLNAHLGVPRFGELPCGECECFMYEPPITPQGVAGIIWTFLDRHAVPAARGADDDHERASREFLRAEAAEAENRKLRAVLRELVRLKDLKDAARVDERAGTGTASMPEAV